MGRRSSNSPPKRQRVSSYCFNTYPGKIPRDTFVDLLSMLDLALQSTVGERVARVELKVAFIGEEATSSLWGDFPDFLGGHNWG